MAGSPRFRPRGPSNSLADLPSSPQIPPTSKFIPARQPQNPYGGDLDNLVVTVLDALARTVLEPAGGDGAVRELFAGKRAAREHEGPGVRISITPDS